MNGASCLVLLYLLSISENVTLRINYLVSPIIITSLLLASIVVSMRSLIHLLELRLLLLSTSLWEQKILRTFRLVTSNAKCDFLLIHLDLGWPVVITGETVTKRLFFVSRIHGLFNIIKFVGKAIQIL